MTPGAAGGHSDVVAPTPRDVRPMKSTAPVGDPIEFTDGTDISHFGAAGGDNIHLESADSQIDVSTRQSVGSVFGAGTIAILRAAAAGGVGYLAARAIDAQIWLTTAGGGEIKGIVSADSADFQVDHAAGGTARIYSDVDGIVIRINPIYAQANPCLELDQGWQQFTEIITTDPVPALNGAALFAKDNGFGKTQLCVRFASGATQVIATEP